MDIPVTKVSENGTTTIPAHIRRRLGIQIGGRVAFVRDGNRYYISSATVEVTLNEAPFLGEFDKPPRQFKPGSAARPTQRTKLH